MIYCTSLELHALSSPTGTRYTLGMTRYDQVWPGTIRYEAGISRVWPGMKLVWPGMTPGMRCDLVWPGMTSIKQVLQGMKMYEQVLTSMIRYKAGMQQVQLGMTRYEQYWTGMTRYEAGLTSLYDPKYWAAVI